MITSLPAIHHQASYNTFCHLLYAILLSLPAALLFLHQNNNTVHLSSANPLLLPHLIRNSNVYFQTITTLLAVHHQALYNTRGRLSCSSPHPLPAALLFLHQNNNTVHLSSANPLLLPHLIRNSNMCFQTITTLLVMFHPASHNIFHHPLLSRYSFGIYRHLQNSISAHLSF